MAILYSYPSKGTIVDNDTFIINDSEDNNKTKQVTAGNILSYIDDNMSYDLQQVLNSGSGATAANQPWAGAIRLTGISGAPQTAISLDTTSTAGSGTASIFANSGDLELQGLSSGGSVIARAAQLSGNLTASAGSFSTTLDVVGLSTLATVDIGGGNIDDTVIGAAVPAASTFTSMAASTVNIDGGTIDNTSIGATLASFSKFNYSGTNPGILTVGNPNADPLLAVAALRVLQGPIQFGNTGGTGFGTDGQVLSSQGSGDHPIWIDQDDLAPSQVCQTVTNKSGGDLLYGDIVSIDPAAPNQPQPDVIKADNTTLLPVIGMVSDTLIANNTEGKITKIGLIPDIDAAQFVGTTPVEGRIVYMAGGVDAGKMTVDRPTGATTGIQNVGIITRVNGGGANFDVQVVAIGRTNALPNNDANALFTTNASNLPISTIGKLEVDIANDTILVGDGAGTTDITVTSNQFRAEVVNNTAAGANNFVIGSSALSQAFANGGGGINNTALGVGAMSGNVGTGTMDAAYNVAVGQNTLASGTGLTGTVLFNTAVGYRAMAGTGAGPTTYNTAIGANALESINSAPAPSFGDLNTAVGSSALFNLTNGEENVAIGSSAGTGVTTGDYNTFVGVNSNSTTANMQLATSIGYNADVTADGGVALGSNSVVTGIGGVALGARAIAAANRLNIKVDNVAGPNPQGGLPNFADRAAALAAGLTPGDVYCATPGGPDNPGTSFLLAII